VQHIATAADDPRNFYKEIVGLLDSIGHAFSSAANDVGHAIENAGEVAQSTFTNPGDVLSDAFGAVRDIANGDNVFSVLKGFAKNEFDRAFGQLGDMFGFLGSSAENTTLSVVDFGLSLNHDL
jgi:hypothetical protein